MRLDAGSYFDSLGMGISDTTTSSSLVVPKQNKNSWHTTPQQGSSQINAPQNNTDETDKNEALEFNAYPNPAAQVIHLSSNMAMQSVAVYDMLGKQCIKVETNGANTAIFDLQKLVNGLYIIRMYSIDGQIAVKQIQVIK